jgi:hypothetical protein
VDCITVEDRGSCSRVGPLVFCHTSSERASHLQASCGLHRSRLGERVWGKEAASGWLGAGSGTGLESSFGKVFHSP